MLFQVLWWKWAAIDPQSNLNLSAEQKRIEIDHVMKKDNKKLNIESEIEDEDEPDQTHPLYVLGLE